MISSQFFTKAAIVCMLLFSSFSFFSQVEKFYQVSQPTSAAMSMDGSFMAYTENGVLHVLPTEGNRTDLITLKNNIDEIKWCDGNQLSYVFHENNFSGIGLVDTKTLKHRDLVALGESGLHLAQGCNYFKDHVYYIQHAPAGTLSIMKVSTKSGKPSIVSEENPSVKKLWIDEDGNAFIREVRKEKKVGLEINDALTKGGWKWVKTLENHLRIQPLMRNKSNGFIAVISNEHSKFAQLEYLVDETNYKQLTQFKQNRVMSAHFNNDGEPLAINTNSTRAGESWYNPLLASLYDKLKEQQLVNPVIIASDSLQRKFIVGKFQPGCVMSFYYATAENGIEQTLTEAEDANMMATDMIDPGNQDILGRLFIGGAANPQSPCVLFIADVNDPVTIDDYDPRVAYLNSIGLSVLKIARFGALFNGISSGVLEMQSLNNKDFSALRVILKFLNTQMAAKPSSLMIFGEGTGCLAAAHAAMYMSDAFSKIVIDEPIMDLTTYCDKLQGKSRFEWCEFLDQELKMPTTTELQKSPTKILIVSNPGSVHDGHTQEVIEALKNQKHEIIEAPINTKDRQNKEMSGMLMIANFLNADIK